MTDAELVWYGYGLISMAILWILSYYYKKNYYKNKPKWEYIRSR